MSYEVLTSGAIIRKFDPHGLCLESCEMIDQPNSYHRKCLVIPENVKSQLRNFISSSDFKDAMRMMFDPLFESFGSVIGFITKNKANTNQTSVDVHSDDSDYTVNLSLNDEYVGGELVLHGYPDLLTPHMMKMARNLKNQITEIKACKNQMVIHRGNHVHEVKKVRDGVRYNLILWCYVKKLPPISFSTDHSKLSVI